MLLALALALALHAAYAWVLATLARRRDARAAWLAWVPVANLVLPFALAGRSPAWAALLLVPPLNLAVWVLVWAEVLSASKRPAWWALGMPIPGVNLALMARAAGMPAARAAAALAVAAVSAAGLGAVSQNARRMEQQELRRRLADEAAETRARAVRALAARPPEPATVDALLAALSDPDAVVRAGAARALGRARGPSVAAALRRSLEDSDAAVRGQAARAYGETGAGSGVEATDAALVRGLLDAARGGPPRELPDVGLVDALARAGRAQPAALQRALADPDPGVRWHAAAALMQLGRAASGAAPALLVAMTDGSWPVRNAAGRALEDVAEPAHVELLARALADPSAETRYHVARAIGRLGPAALAAVPALTAALRDEDSEVRMESVWALAAFGPAARAAVPPLQGALADPEPQVRAAAAHALAAVDEAPAAAAALARMTSDPAPEVRRAARAALARLRRATRAGA